MKEFLNQKGKSYRFFVGTLFCVFWTEERAGEMLLWGEETERGVVLYRDNLSFSHLDAHRVEKFAQILAESKTFPRMMKELAEEYFSSAF